MQKELTINSMSKYTPQVREHLASGGCGGDVCTMCDGTGSIRYDAGNPGEPWVSDDCYYCRGTGMR